MTVVQNRYRNAARYYARRAIPIFRLPYGSKIPFAGSHGNLDATTDRDQIETWFEETDRLNVAAATGEGAGFWVLDLDFYRPGVREDLDGLEAKHGGLPDTLTARTPRGGEHRLFRWNPDLPVTSFNTLPYGFDTKGNGGYIMLSPSYFDGGKDGKSSAGKYRWEGGKPDFENGIAEAPDWIYEYLRPATKSGHHAARSSSEWAKAMEPVGEGGRHERIKSIAGLLVARLRNQGEAAAQLVYAFNDARCIPPLPDDEVYRILEWVGEQQARKGSRHG